MRLKEKARMERNLLNIQSFFKKIEQPLLKTEYFQKLRLLSFI